MDEFKTLIRRGVFIVISAAVFMPAGAIIYKTRADEIMKERFEKQEIKLMKFEYIESKAWEKLEAYIKESNTESERQLIIQNIMKYRKLPVDGK